MSSHLGVWRGLSCGVRVGDLRDYLGLPGFDEDDGRYKDDQYRYDEGDYDWFNRRVSYALFGGGVARCGLLLAHGYLDAEAAVCG
jgi:hypothetical protein